MQSRYHYAAISSVRKILSFLTSSTPGGIAGNLGQHVQLTPEGKPEYTARTVIFMKVLRIWFVCYTFCKFSTNTNQIGLEMTVSILHSSIVHALSSFDEMLDCFLLPPDIPGPHVQYR